MASKIEYSKDGFKTNLYIPDIGDKIVLTKDWTFTIYGESRNDEFISSIMDNPLFERKKATDLVNDVIKKSGCKPDDKWYDTTCFNSCFYALINVATSQEWFYRREYTINSGKNVFKFEPELMEEIRPKMTIPAGITICVDRIYIRKGSADYSSVTFRVEKFPDKKNHRFWAKLSDTRGIEGEVYSRIR